MFTPYYQGKMTRIRTAPEQDSYEEVDTFVWQYLHSRRFSICREAQRVLHTHLESYPQADDVVWEELSAWLDARILPYRNYRPPGMEE